METGRVVFEQARPAYLQLYCPSADLADVVEYYFELDLTTHLRPFSIVALPSLNTLITVPLTATAKKYYSHFNQTEQELNGPKILGSISHALTCTYASGAKEFAVKFKPGFLQQLLQLDVDQLMNSHLSLADHLPAGLIASIANAKDGAERIILMEAYLNTKMEVVHLNKKLKLVQQAIAIMTNTNDVMPIAAICKQIAVSSATLTRYFNEVLGLSPKQCFKILRFKNGLQHYQTYGSNYIYDEIGYTDFSHFVKDAKNLTNKVPSDL
jgi:AraC-like DNA-binding protein